MKLWQLLVASAVLWISLVGMGIATNTMTLIHIGANIFGSLTILLGLFLLARWLYRKTKKDEPQS